MTKEQAITRVKHSVMYIDDRETADYIIKTLEQQPSDDCVSRQAVKEGMIKYGFRASDMTVTEFVEDELSPVTPIHGICMDCSLRDPEDKKCDCGHTIQWQLPRKDNWYCADFKKRGN